MKSETDRGKWSHTEIRHSCSRPAESPQHCACLFWTRSMSVNCYLLSSTQVPRRWAAGSCVRPVTSPTALAAVPSLSESWCARVSACRRTSCRTPSSVASGGEAAPQTTAASRRTPGHAGSSCSVPTATLGRTKSAWSPPASASVLGRITTSRWPRRSLRRNAARSTVVCLKIGARTTRLWRGTHIDPPPWHPGTEDRYTHTHAHVTQHINQHISFK